MSVNPMPRCDYPGCDEDGTTISRLSPEGYLVATGKKPTHFTKHTGRFHYCAKCHSNLMTNVWNRVRTPDDKDDDNVAPTAI